MKDKKLDQVLKEWDATWVNPGVGEHLRQLGHIVLLVFAFLLIVWASERLKEIGEAPVQHTETPAE